MNIELIEKDFSEKLNKNFPVLSRYFDSKIEIFFELETLIFEITNCLLFEFYRASITLTNHLLERLLKLSLIYNEAGIGPTPCEQWNSVFDEPNKKYGSMNFGNTINECKKNELISDREKNILYDTIRVLMRNGFSHADSREILDNLPDDSKAYSVDLLNPSEINEVSFNHKIIPPFQEIQMETFAKATAKSYFNFVFGLIIEIEKRLAEKQK